MQTGITYHTRTTTDNQRLKTGTKYDKMMKWIQTGDD